MIESSFLRDGRMLILCLALLKKATLHAAFLGKTEVARTTIPSLTNHLRSKSLVVVLHPK